MTNSIREIEAAIDSSDFDKARALLKEVLREPNANIYFLASKVALNEQQKIQFLHKALEDDPFHVQAHEELSLIKSTANPTADMATVANTPKEAKKSSELIAEEKNIITYENLIQEHERTIKQNGTYAIVGLGMIVSGILLLWPIFTTFGEDDASCFAVPIVFFILTGVLFAIVGVAAREKATKSLTETEKELADTKSRIVEIKANTNDN